MGPIEFEDYRTFLKKKIQQNESLRGYQSKVAAAAGCSRSFLSQVLAPDSGVEMTRDQAYSLAVFWELGSIETEYFLGLVDLSRANTSLLKRTHTEKP